MNQIEYLILSYALEYSENLKNVVIDWQLPNIEVAIAANRLFQNGDIRSNISKESDVVLTTPQIQAHLDGKFHFLYYLTPQGGERWAKATKANWNQYFSWSGFDCGQSKIICTDRQLIEQLLQVSEYVHSDVPILGTEVWDVLEPWEPTYWKTLPLAYRVRYQTRKKDWHISRFTPPELIEVDKRARQWYAEIELWYAEPEFEVTPPNPIDYATIDYYTPPSRLAIQKAEYLILRQAVTSNYSLRVTAYDCHLSDAEVVDAADSLFQNGYILTKVYDECDNECGFDVILTKTGIQDSLNGQLQDSYYLTPSGGAYWESIAHPNWDKFLKLDSLENPREGKVIGAKREIIEELLALNLLRGLYKQIPGTEVWKVMEPWSATYWKTLPKGYEVIYQIESG